MKDDSIKWKKHILQETVAVYVFLIMVVYPLYYQNKYYDIGYAKWKFFLILTLGVGTIWASVSFFTTIVKIYRDGFIGYKGWNISTVDGFVLAYFISVLLSSLCSPYKEQIIWGYSGWYMGVIAQLCFLLIYYFVSRYWRRETTAVLCYFTAAFFVCLLAVLMRYGIDPLGLYVGLEEKYIANFLSTIGQVTWFSSYVALIIPLGVFVFWFYDNVYARILGGVFIVVGFMASVTQNCDSIFIALGILLWVMFYISLESKKQFRRFLEMLIICFTSFQLTGILQKIFTERVILPDRLSLFFTQGKVTRFFLLVIILFYVCFRKSENERWLDINRIKKIRTGLSGMVVAAVIITVIYITLNTLGRLPENMSSSSNYLLFDEYWGNNRGFSWTIAIKAFFKGDIVRKLLGCGPDGFSLYVQNFFNEELTEKWGGGGMLACAHNEWLNTLVNMGVAGFFSYMGIFISAVCRFFGKSKEHPELMAISISIMCYMGHNFFCYQQIVCTPVVFILIGAGEAIIRDEKYISRCG